MYLIGYGSYFSKYVQLKGGADNQNIPEAYFEKSTLEKTKSQNSGQEHRRYSTRNSDEGGDKDPTRKTIEKSHTIHIPITRKT
jgi:hypothetical protein